MNEATKDASSITSCVLSKYISGGGEIAKLETLRGEAPDDTIHVFEACGRYGTYISDNAGVFWYDADFDRVIAALRSGDTSDLPDCKAVEAI